MVIRGKGTVLHQMIGTVYTAVAQLISLDLPDMESETFEADTLDNANAAIPHKGTGRTEGGSVGFEGFLDPVLASFTTLLALLTTPPAIGSEESYKIIFADTGTSEWAFTGAGLSIGGTVALGDGVKFTGGIKLDGLPTFP
ncbi:hypothetical protein LCGC14_2859280 [marine sediment metagenome]|uniref:Uncharacterized protein n=1 Tax=marine sediment metagenome TaxID=412755 RepID=A0A0F8Y645_9ZZZZ